MECDNENDPSIEYISAINPQTLYTWHKKYICAKRAILDKDYIIDINNTDSGYI